jgi:hypothetical protein
MVRKQDAAHEMSSIPRKETGPILWNPVIFAGFYGASLRFIVAKQR